MSTTTFSLVQPTLNESRLLQLLEREFDLQGRDPLDAIVEVLDSTLNDATRALRDVRLKSFKFLRGKRKDKYVIKYLKPKPIEGDEIEWEETTTESIDAAHDSLSMALKNLIPYALSVIEVNWKPEECEIVGVHYSYADDEEQTQLVMFTLLHKNSLGEKTSVNTHPRSAEPVGGGDERDKCYPEKVGDLLDTLDHEIRRYLGGDRPKIFL